MATVMARIAGARDIELFGAILQTTYDEKGIIFL